MYVTETQIFEFCLWGTEWIQYQRADNFFFTATYYSCYQHNILYIHDFLQIIYFYGDKVRRLIGGGQFTEAPTALFDLKETTQDV